MPGPVRAPTMRTGLSARTGMPAVTEDTGRVAPQAPPARLWWILLARAAVAFLLGVLVLLSQKTRPALGNFIGVYWLVGSLLTLRWVAGHRRQPGNRLVWAAAILGVVAGLLVLLRFALEDVLSADLVLPGCAGSRRASRPASPTATTGHWPARATARASAARPGHAPAEPAASSHREDAAARLPGLDDGPGGEVRDRQGVRAGR